MTVRHMKLMGRCLQEGQFSGRYEDLTFPFLEYFNQWMMVSTRDKDLYIFALAF